MPPDPMLSIDAVSVRYGATRAVDGISLDVRQGEFVSLLGPSGCGKTTLLRAIAGYVTPSEGAIRLGGEDVTRLPPRERRIGMVFQSYALFPHLTVEENVAFPLSVQKWKHADIAPRVAEMLRTVHLDGFGARYPAQLSGGQQQRVALARALAFRPRLLLLDEPLGALDLRLREQMQAEIRRIHRETGVTTIFVTHDQGEALSLSDRVAVLHRGRIEQIDTPRGLYEAPHSDVVADFVGRSNILPLEPAGGGWRIAGSAVAVVGGAPGRALSVRPERVHLASDGGPDRLGGTIIDIQYNGLFQAIRLRTDAGAEIVAHDGAPWQVGQRAFAVWRASDATLVDLSNDRT